MTAHDDAVKAAAEADYLLPVQVLYAGPYNDPTNGDYFKGRLEHSPAHGMTTSISYSQVVTPAQLLAAERARVAAVIRDAADLIDEHADGMSSDTAIRYRARAEAFRDAARVAETAPEEPTDA